MRKHRLSASFAGTAVAAGAAITTAITTGQPASAAPASNVVRSGAVELVSATDVQAWYWGVEAGIDPTTQNKTNAFLSLNYARKLDGLPYWGEVLSHPAPAAPSNAAYLNALAKWFAGVEAGQSHYVAPASHAVASSSNSGVSGGVWAALRQCESGGNYSTNTGNGFGGAYQFTQQTWSGLGEPGSPSTASPAQQDAAAQKLQAQDGWGQWPACSAKLGLR